MFPNKRVLLVARYYIIEPLGIIYLLGLAKSLGWEAKVCLIKGDDFEELYEDIRTWKPDLVGFSIWTGFHTLALAACDKVREIGVKVVIGGPHATYFSPECLKHADWVVKGEGFRSFRRLLDGELAPGHVFDGERMAEGFPMPDRETVYKRYPELGASPIKSIFGSIGCPFQCSYCYAPTYNTMYGGFELNLRSVDDLIKEGQEIRDRWPAAMIYFQDDIFGYKLDWLAEFSRRWREEVCVPWHCQIRLELTHGETGDRRLDLFKEGGCTGITLAIESGNAFLREFVLRRAMTDELIYKGIRKIQARGLTLRTEQILAVPMSDISTDLGTLALNVGLGVEMGWTSILAPYGGTAMGGITTDFQLYKGNNDDIKASFFDRSILKHLANGREVLEPIVRARKQKSTDNPLLNMEVKRRNGNVGIVCEKGQLHKLAEVRYNTPEQNECYADQTELLQRLFNALTLMPAGHKLGAKIVGSDKRTWTWANIGRMTSRHIERVVGPKSQDWVRTLAHRMGYSTPDELPLAVRDNPHYFCFFPSGERLARKVADEGLFGPGMSTGASFDRLGARARHHLFHTSLYLIEPADPPIAKS